MRSNEDFEDMVKKDLDVRASDGTYDRLRDVVLDAHGLSQTNTSAATPSLTGRTIMRKRIVKLAIAAAVLAALGLGILEFLNTGSKSGVVWADVARKVQASRGVVFRVTERIEPDTYDQQVDFSTQYFTSTQSRLDNYKGGEIIKTIWGDCDTKTVVLVDHFHKSYIKATGEKMPDSLGAMDPNRWVQSLLSCRHRELGQKTIDGVRCEGIETTDPAFFGGGTPPEPPVARLWVGVETGYPVRFESERVYDGARHSLVQDRFQWDADLDGSLFEPNIPADYLFIPPPH
jgi:hypothetical protein